MRVRLQASSDGSSWSEETNAVTNASGGFSFNSSISGRRQYRVVTDAGDLYASTASSIVVVVPTEADDEIAEAPTPGSWPVSGSIRDADDPQDVYRIQLEAGTAVDFSLLGPADSSFGMRLYAPGAASLGVSPVASVDGYAWPRQVSYRVPYSGVYFVVVTRQSGSGAYTLARTVRWTTSVRIEAPPTSMLQYGGSATVVFRAARYDGGVPPSRAMVECSPGGWTEIGLVDGLGSYSFRPNSRTRVRVYSIADDMCAESEPTYPLYVRVKPRFSRVSVSRTTVRSKQSFVVSGDLWPRHATGTTVWVKAQRFDARGKNLGKPVRLRARVTSNSGDKSHFKGTVSLHTRGRYAFAAYQNADGAHEAGKSTQWGKRPVTVK